MRTAVRSLPGRQDFSLKGPVHIVPPDGVPNALPLDSTYAFSSTMPGICDSSPCSQLSGLLSLIVTRSLPLAPIDLTFWNTWP